MNKLVINGNLTKDMEVKDIKGNLVGEFTIANNQRIGKDNEQTTFLKCVIFGSRVETLQAYLLKGAKVLVDGRLSINTVKNEDDIFNTYVSLYVDGLEIEKFVNVEEEQPKKKQQYKKAWR